MTNFYSFHGTIAMISDLVKHNGEGESCNKLISVENKLGALVNFVVSPSTYFVDHVMVAIGDRVTGYYDGNAPTLLIYPPQYPALVMVKDSLYQNVKVDYFNSQLESSDGRLRLNISPYSQIVLTMGNPLQETLRTEI